MRDSRIGSFGGAALVLSLVFRVAALSAALAAGCLPAAAALVTVAAVSRAGGLMPLAWLDPARSDGSGAAVGRLPGPAFAAACALALGFALALAPAAAGFGRAFAAVLGAGLGAAAMTALARREIGGQTGDVAGAAQQWAEIAAWCGLLIGRAGA
jgi:adenosylcobinamide-GDP ribazoletransferase